MKKYFRKLLCSIICLATMVSGITAFAQTPMQMEWRGDYSDNANPKLIVTFTPSAQYTQQVIVVAYPTAVENPTLANYVRMEEIAVKEAKTTNVTFNITNAFSATGGAYTVEVQGNGHLYGTSSDEIDVYVIKQGDIADLLTEFKSATESDFATVLGKVMPALQLVDEPVADDGGARKAKRITSMIGIRTNDFGGTFSNLENVRDAWNTSDILVYIGETAETEEGAEGVAGKLRSNAALLEIDTRDADFLEHIDELCEDLLTYDHEYNNGAGIQSLKDLKDAIGETLGTIAINNASETGITAVFNKYKSYFDISAATLADYGKFSPTYQSKALRALYNEDEDGDGTGDGGFLKASELVTAFEEAVREIKLEGGTVTTGPSGDRTPSQDSPGTTIAGPISAPTAPQAPSSTSSFRDVSSSHWAYPYVTELASKNIIGGYDDGTFKPNNNVTREEFVKMIIGAAGLLSLDKECDFADVSKDAWYYDYVSSAYAAGIVSGTDDTTFGIGTNITRQDVAVIAARVLEHLGKSASQAVETTLTDFDTVSDYAQDSVKMLNGMGIINGFDDGSFMPHNALTRAEAATIICKLINSL